MSALKLPYGVAIPETELEFSASRSGGPGGQSVNTTDSKVELRWSILSSTALSDPQRDRLLTGLASRLTLDGVLILHGSEHKSQHRNREAVRMRFITMVSEALAPPQKRRKTLPTHGSKERRIRTKKQRGEVKRLRRDPET